MEWITWLRLESGKNIIDKNKKFEEYTYKSQYTLSAFCWLSIKIIKTDKFHSSYIQMEN